MPRDAYILHSEPVTIPDLIRVGATVDPELTMRTLYEGVAVQFVDADYRSVLTVQAGRMLRDGSEIARLVPSAPAFSGETWFSEAFVPWDDAEVGLAILAAVATTLGATVIIEDGS